MLERFVNELGLTGLTLMVQDWGGPIGLGFAARRHELVRRLIIGNMGHGRWTGSSGSGRSAG
jgi:haloalkane dehalogenase